MKKKLDSRDYEDLDELSADFTLMGRNAIAYNEAGSDVALTAKHMLLAGRVLIDACRRDIDLYVHSAQGATERSLVGSSDESSDNDEEGDNNEGGGAVLTEPQLRLIRAGRASEVTLPFWAQNRFHRGLPRMGTDVEFTTKVPIPEQLEYIWNGPTPVTELRFGLFQTFEPTYDSSEASLSQGEESNLARGGVSESLQKHLTNGVGSGILVHSASVLALCGRINCSTSTIFSAMSKVNGLGSFSSDFGVQASEIADSQTNRHSDGNDSIVTSENVSETEIVDIDHKKEDISPPDVGLAATASGIMKLADLQKTRMLGNDPCAVDDHELEIATGLRDRLLTLTRDAAPKDLISRKTLYQALGVQLLMPGDVVPGRLVRKLKRRTPKETPPAVQPLIRTVARARRQQLQIERAADLGRRSKYEAIETAWNAQSTLPSAALHFMRSLKSVYN